MIKQYISALTLVFIFCFSFINAQQKKLDSIFIKATLNESTNEITVKQTFHLNTIKDTLFFNAWINAYSNKNTPLVNSKLEEQKADLYFAKAKERGSLTNLAFYTEDNIKLDHSIVNNEFVRLENIKNLKKNIIVTTYTLKIPQSNFTEYGVDKENNYFLKYFFLQPSFNKNNKTHFDHFLDMETEQTFPYYYEVEFENINSKFIVSNLTSEKNKLAGIVKAVLEINLLNYKPEEFTVNNYKVSFAYPYQSTNYTKEIIEKQLNFLEKNIGELNQKNIILNNNNKKNNVFFGIDDIEVSKKFKIENFTKQEKEALKLFYILSEAYISQLITTNKSKDHWIENGLKTYLFITYIDTCFPKKLLLTGSLAERKILGFKPLKLIYLTKLSLNERFNIMYLFLSRFGNDQILNTNFEKLSKFNQNFVSGNRTGLLFKSIEDYLPENEFNNLIKSFVKQNKDNEFSGLDFTSFLEKNASKPMNWFNESFIKNDYNIDFKLKKIKIEKDSIKILIKNKTNYSGPFKISGYKNNNIIYSKWLEKNENKLTEIKIPKDSIKNIVLNLDSYLPEHFDQDNYKNVGGLFHNSKKLYLSLFRSIENPKVNTLIFTPDLVFNTQNNFLASLHLSNSSFLPKKYTYTVVPSYSFGTNTFLYSISGGFFEKWKTGLIDKLFLNSNYSVFNSSINSRAQTFGASGSVSFRRYNPRLPITSLFFLSYQNIQRELPPTATLADFDYKNYELKEVGYNYRNNGYIHDFFGGVTLENSNLFNKLIVESCYRIKLTKHNRINYRLFGGLFLNNDSSSNSFNFGISRINDYKFRNSILDRSNKQIPLNQQYILGDAGFKSFINETSNQWVISNNIHYNINKRFGVYTDFGFYKNKNNNPKFIYDSGLSFTAIEDFLELYFPMQSSLGFEPELKNYHQRVRFVFTFNLGSVISYFRRGKF